MMKYSTLSVKIGIKAKKVILVTSVQLCIGDSNHCNMARYRNSYKEVKLHLFTDDIIVYVETLRNLPHTKKTYKI